MRGSALHRVRGAAMVVALAACDQPTDPIDNPVRRLIVHAVMDAGSLSQVVNVEYIDSNFGHRLASVGGCVVTITAPTGEVFTATEDENADVGLVYRVPLGAFTPLIPGGTYTLYVRTQLGEEATGTTTLPQFTEMPPPEVVASFARARDTLRMDWQRVPKAARYEVAITSVYRFETRQFTELTYRAFADTTITVAGTARTLENDQVFVLGTLAEVHVSAVDDNYYAYYHLSVDPFAGAPPSRITGALGVFGSIAPVRYRQYQEVR